MSHKHKSENCTQFSQNTLGIAYPLAIQNSLKPQRTIEQIVGSRFLQ
jgi:hypothetical protein